MFIAQRRAALLAGLLIAALLLPSCGFGLSDNSLYVPDLTDKADTYNGKDVTVLGAYVWRPANAGAAETRVLALGASTDDSGRDAQPLGEFPIWLDTFPDAVAKQLHNPGDSIYGFVRLNGRFEAGSYGPEGSYKYRLVLADAQPIEQVQRVTKRIDDTTPAAGQVSLFELARNPAQYNGQTVTLQGYYFWNSIIYVLAEGVSTEEDGASPLPDGQQIWMEGWPPPESAKLNVGPNNSFVWGKVEVTATFQSGGAFGKDGAYKSQLTIVDGKGRSLETGK
ncbi:MAG: hypothetical protein H7Y32_03950 [Chloroflexales bacterium]|nr:hypothetical protein [Chloroflexales bacterium]